MTRYLYQGTHDHTITTVLQRLFTNLSKICVINSPTAGGIMSLVSQADRNIFENLFVLEAANNHWGDVERGKEIIQQFATVVRYNNIKAAIKFQFRDVDNFIHEEYKGNQDIRYIKKTEATKMSREQYGTLANAVRQAGCIPMATPFDEKSVELCDYLDFPIIKVASSDINDWALLEAVAHTKRPVIASSGGASEKSLDDLVTFFENRNIPLALNHCVSLYPSEDHELELSQIDYLKARYPNHVIGLSSHEYHDWHSSMLISYAKGARTWERHVDIDFNSVPVSNYCSLPHQVDEWFKYFHKAQEMCGNSNENRRIVTSKEIQYLDALVRGIYAKRDLPKGYVVDNRTFAQDFQLAVPLRKGQLSTREVLNGLSLQSELKAGSPVTIDDVNGPYSEHNEISLLIKNRGI
jgi:N-acetylneuraminate synthase